MRARDWHSKVEAPVIVIAGGAHGKKVERYRRRWPWFDYILFEPDPYYHEMLRRFDGDQKVVVIHKALSDERGDAPFYANKLPRTSSLYPRNQDEPWGAAVPTLKVLTVECETLDLYCAEHGIERIGFIELDAQGAELKILRGAERLLKRKAIDCMMVETFYVPIYEGIPLGPELKDYLKEMGYICAGPMPQREWDKGVVKWNDLIWYKGGRH